MVKVSVCTLISLVTKLGRTVKTTRIFFIRQTPGLTVYRVSDYLCSKRFSSLTKCLSHVVLFYRVEMSNTGDSGYFSKIYSKKEREKFECKLTYLKGSRIKKWIGYKDWELSDVLYQDRSGTS